VQVVWSKNIHKHLSLTCHQKGSRYSQNDNMSSRKLIGTLRYPKEIGKRKNRFCLSFHCFCISDCNRMSCNHYVVCLCVCSVLTTKRLSFCFCFTSIIAIAIISGANRAILNSKYIIVCPRRITIAATVSTVHIALNVK